MKLKLWGLLAAVVFSTTFTACDSKNGGASAVSPAVFQLRMVTEVAAGDCDCDDMVVVSGAGPKETLHVLHPVLLDGTDLKEAWLINDNPGHPQIALLFTAHGAKRLAEVTRDSIGKRLAMIIDGKLYSAPVIQAEISNGGAVIAGSFNEQEAKELVAKLDGR